jgi:hypothetical protein
MPSLSRGSSMGLASRPVSQEDALPVSRGSSAPYAYDMAPSAPSTPGSERPIFLQDAPSAPLGFPGSMRDVMMHSGDDAMSPVAQMKARRREGARAYAQLDDSDYRRRAMEIKHRNSVSNVFDDTPMDVPRRQVRDHLKSSVFAPEPMAPRSPRRYEYSDIFHQKADTQREIFAPRRVTKPSQIIFG